MVNVILNVIWLVLGGLGMAACWFVAAIVMVISIVGIPFARAAVNMAIFSLWPFGRKVVDRSEITGDEDLGTGPAGVIGNIIWLIFAGLWLALAHLIIGFTLALTIIGIPFAWAHLKLAGIALWPIGKVIVPA